MNLLNKFKNVTVKDNCGLTETNIKFLDNLTDQYNTKRKELLEYQLHIKNVSKFAGEPCNYEIKNRRYKNVDEVEVRISDTQSPNPFSHLTPSTYYLQAYIQNSLLRLARIYYKQIIQYISTEYSLNVSRDLELSEMIENQFINNKEVSDVEYMETVKIMKNYCGGVPFIEYGKQLVRNALTKYFENRTINRVKSKLTIHNVMRYGGFYSPPSWKYNDNNLNILSEAFYLFQNDEVGTISAFEDLYNTNVDFSKKIPIDIDLIKEIKVFKNGRLDIIFNNAQILERFVSEFKIEIS